MRAGPLLLLVLGPLALGDDPGGHHGHEASYHGAPIRHGAFVHHADDDHHGHHHGGLQVEASRSQPDSGAATSQQLFGNPSNFFQPRTQPSLLGTQQQQTLDGLNSPTTREDAAAAVAAVVLAESGGDRPDEPTLAQLLEAAPDLITFHSAVVAAGLTDMLSGPGPITVFAPTDTAFQKVPLGQLHSLQADKAALTALLRRHIVEGVIIQVKVAKYSGDFLYPSLFQPTNWLI